VLASEIGGREIEVVAGKGMESGGRRRETEHASSKEES
jgi:hypothetical protein